MRKRRTRAELEGERENYWPAFTDLTSTIALILFVLVLLAYLQNLISGKNLEYMKSQLSSASLQIDDSKKQLRLLEDDMQRTKAEIENGKALLTLSQQKVEQQEQLIAESNQKLGDLRFKLQSIAVLRVDVLKKVKQSLEAELRARTPKDALQISIADNGNIVINESLVFDYNSFTIKKEGKKVVGALASAFAELLKDENIVDNIDVISIQGHTDERGSVEYNRELSAKRANAVLNLMFEAAPVLGQSFGSFFAASAYSKFRPADKEQNETAFARNRRIEISVVVKDSNLQRVIDEYMRQNVPPTENGSEQPPFESIDKDPSQ